MTTWTKQKLGDVVDFIDGDRGKQYPKQEEFSDSGECLFLSTKNVPNVKFDFSEKMFISAERDSKLHKGKLQRGDYVLTTRGTVGNFAYFGDNIGFDNIRINSGMVILRKKSEKLENEYLQYYLMSPLFNGQTKSRASGSAQPQLPIRDMVSMEVLLPDKTTQTRIASVLSAYDDLIENNGKRIKRLEEMAQLLYAEWFVKFKFPRSTSSGQAGHEKAKMIDSGTEYGKIPAGWEMKNVESLIKRVPVGKKYENKSVFETGKVPVLDQGKTGFIGYHNDEPGLKASVENPIIVFANHTCYQNIIVYPFSAIQNVLPFIPNDERDIFWLHWATKDLIKFNDYKGHWPEFMAKKLVVPSIGATKRFGALVGKYVAMRYELESENKSLSKTRDLLIPQLVTGRRELK